MLNKKLLGAPGLTRSDRTLLGSPGMATRSKRTLLVTKGWTASCWPRRGFPHWPPRGTGGPMAPSEVPQLQSLVEKELGDGHGIIDGSYKRPFQLWPFHSKMDID